jgi:hypothetical protein
MTKKLIGAKVALNLFQIIEFNKYVHESDLILHSISLALSCG